MAGVKKEIIMSESFATIEDITNLYRALSPEEQTRAANLLPVVSDRLRILANNYGRNLDQMITKKPALASVAKSVTVDIVARALQTPTEGAPMSQFSESGMGYSASGTFLVPGGGIFIKREELKALGLRRPRYGFVDLCGKDEYESVQ